ncbi:MAG: hypothetical protein R3D98_01480 [Candidatus Krumholzibacteriia bacterium]
MTLLAWIALSLTALVSLGLAALTDHGARREPALRLLAVATGGLLVAAGADVLAVVWLLLALPLVWQVRTSGAEASAGTTPAGWRLLGGVLTAGLGATLYLLCQRVDWFDLPAGPFRAGAADLAGRLLTDDLVLVLGLLLMVLALLGAGGPQRGVTAGVVRPEPEEDGS